MNTGAMQEITGGFMKEAEKAAMSKVVDVYSAPLLKHTFLRYGRSFDYEEKHPNLQNDRLSGIFKMGLVSEDLATRIKHPHDRNWNDPNNVTGVSLLSEGVPFSDAAIQAIIPWMEPFKENVPNPPIPAEEAFILLIDPNLPNPIKGAKNMLGANEKIYRRRVKQEKFKGLVILDDSDWMHWSSEAANNLRDKRFFDTTTFDAEKLSSEVVELMKKYFGTQTESYIPIYGYNGNLIWPKKMSHDEVKEYIQDRNQSKL